MNVYPTWPRVERRRERVLSDFSADQGGLALKAGANRP